MSINCILFDLDGTLLNTNNLVLQSFRHTFKKHLNREVSDEELFPHFGVPLVQIMEDFDPEQTEAMLTTYREFNLAKHDELTVLFPGVTETLEDLRRQDVTMGVVSSKIKRMVHRGLDLFSLTGFFDTIVAFEDTDAHKPNAAPVNRALQDLPHARKEKVLMVGDSPYDILCAANAGVKSAAVEWTVHGIQKLKVHEPDLILSRFDDLLKLTLR